MSIYLGSQAITLYAGGTGSSESYISITIPAGRMRGDLNGDGKLTQDDVDLLSAYVFDPSTTPLDDTQLLCADVRGDGSINGTDTLNLRQYLNNIRKAGSFGPEVTGNWTNNPNYDTEDGQYYTDISVPGVDANKDVNIIIYTNDYDTNFVKGVCLSGKLRLYVKLCPINELRAEILIAPGTGVVTISEVFENTKVENIAVEVTENTTLSNDIYTTLFGGDDADATAGDILVGYRGMVNHQIVEGTLPESAIHDYVTIDGVEVTRAMNLVTSLKNNDTKLTNLPYQFYNGSAVVYNNEIHILGTGDTNNRTSHYKYNGSSWTSVSTLPYNFYDGSAVVYNNEIHILGTGISNYNTKHYKYNGSTWTSVSTLPYNFYEGSAVVYNNEIHILGGSYSAAYYTNHYKYNGSAWTSVSTLPYNFYNGSAVVYNNEIHILGSKNSNNYTKHYKYNGSSWTSVSTLPYQFYQGAAVVYNNEIHILGAGDSNNRTSHYKYNGSSWTSVSTLPYEFGAGRAVVYNNQIHILGGVFGDNYTNFYSIIKLCYEEV